LRRNGWSDGLAYKSIDAQTNTYGGEYNHSDGQDAYVLYTYEH